MLFEGKQLQEIGERELQNFHSLEQLMALRSTSKAQCGSRQVQIQSYFGAVFIHSMASTPQPGAQSPSRILRPNLRRRLRTVTNRPRDMT